MNLKSYRAKELVWNKTHNGKYSEDMFGNAYYLTHSIDIGWWYEIRPTVDFLINRSGHCSTLKAAKERCQSHYNELWQSGGVEV